MTTCCVIGIGCEDHADQIAGLLVARAVARRALGQIDVVESSGAPGELIRAWSATNHAVIVEAMPGDVPGAVRRSQPRPADTEHASARVSPRVREALAAGPLPPRVTVITIGGANFRRGGPVTPAVAAAAERVADELLAGVPSLAVAV